MEFPPLIASDSVCFFLPSPFCINIPILCCSEGLLIQSQLIWHLWPRLDGFKFTLLSMKKEFLKKVNTIKKTSQSLIYLKRYDFSESWHFKFTLKWLVFKYLIQSYQRKRAWRDSTILTLSSSWPEDLQNSH